MILILLLYEWRSSKALHSPLLRSKIYEKMKDFKIPEISRLALLGFRYTCPDQELVQP